jgi:excisionase family DNA binding protein
MTNQINETKRYLDVDELAKYLVLSPHTIRDWIKTRKIPFLKFDRAIRFDLDEIEKWLQNKKVPCLEGRYLTFCLSSFNRLYSFEVGVRSIPTEVYKNENL